MKRNDTVRRARGESGAARNAFTLIELLLVLVILAALAAIVVPKFTNVSPEAKKTAAASGISNIETALDAFQVQCSRYPTTEEGLAALVNQPANAKGWQGPYLKKGVPKDPWGNPFQYRCPGQHNATTFDLFSCGPDGEVGGGDDIDNWSDK